MTNLNRKSCKPCEGEVEPLSREEAGEYLKQVDVEWKLSDDGKKIRREFVFNSFMDAIDFVNRAARIAEAEGHHPDMYVYFKKVVFELTTHAIGGLSQNDFILAAKTDEISA